jgi:hypothetical protein
LSCYEDNRDRAYDFIGENKLSALDVAEIKRRSTDFVDDRRCAPCAAIEQRDQNWVFFHDSVIVNAEGAFTRADLIHMASHLDQST